MGFMVNRIETLKVFLRILRFLLLIFISANDSRSLVWIQTATLSEFLSSVAFHVPSLYLMHFPTYYPLPKVCPSFTRRASRNFLGGFCLNNSMGLSHSATEEFPIPDPKLKDQPLVGCPQTDYSYFLS
jgi:hypothetical protein